MKLQNTIENSYGAVMTYSAAATTASIGHWFENNWFLVLSAIAVLIRMGIDGHKLYETWHKRKTPNINPGSLYGYFN